MNRQQGAVLVGTHPASVESRRPISTVGKTLGHRIAHLYAAALDGERRAAWGDGICIFVRRLDETPETCRTITLARAAEHALNQSATVHTMMWASWERPWTSCHSGRPLITDFRGLFSFRSPLCCTA